MGLVAERWTDSRMDDLKGQVEGLDRRMEQGFRDLRVEIGGLRSDVKGQIDGLRGEMKGQGDGLRGEMKGQIDGLRGEMNERFDRLDIRFDRMVYAILGFGASMFAAMMGLIAAVILSI
jgi:hypothetical protein